MNVINPPFYFNHSFTNESSLPATHILTSIPLRNLKTNSVSISLKCEQLLVNDATASLTFALYEGENAHTTRNSGASSTLAHHHKVLEEKVLTDKIADGFVGSFHITYTSRFPFITPTITSSVADFKYELTITPNHQHSAPLLDCINSRDNLVELFQDTLHTRQVSDFKNDAQHQLLKGVSTFNLSCRGDLTTNDHLLELDSVAHAGHFYTSNTHDEKNLNITSTSTHDNVAGIGARKIKITGLNNQFKELSEVITLVGTGVNTTSHNYTEVNKAEVIDTAPTGLQNNGGTIKIYDSTSGVSNPMCIIPIGHGLSMNPQFCVPKGHSLLLHKLAVEYHCEDDSSLFLNKYEWITSPHNSIIKKKLKNIFLHGSGTMTIDLSLKIPEQHRIALSGKTSITPTGVNKVSVELFGYLQKDTLTPSSGLTHNDIFFISGKDSLPIDY